MTWEWPRPKLPLRLKFLGYAGSIGVCKSRVEASSDLWKVEHVYYPPAIKEDALFSSEVRDAREEVEATGPRAALAITSSN